MDKVFKALDDLFDLVTCQGSFEKGQKCYDILEEAITELKAIKEAEPSEALKGLKHIKKYYVPEPCSSTTYDYLEIIQQTLLKTQFLEKENADNKRVLEIIKEKDVDIYILNSCKTVDEYNSKIVHIVGETRELTQDEFDLLKRWLVETK